MVVTLRGLQARWQALWQRRVPLAVGRPRRLMRTLIEASTNTGVRALSAGPGRERPECTQARA